MPPLLPPLPVTGSVRTVCFDYYLQTNSSSTIQCEGHDAHSAAAGMLWIISTTGSTKFVVILSVLLDFMTAIVCLHDNELDMFIIFAVRVKFSFL
jgi:hypothetical protein